MYFTLSPSKTKKTKQILRNVALHSLLIHVSSVVNGCCQNESLIKTDKAADKNITNKLQSIN